ncbi:hypothetical protein B0I35DRAFT_198982 [Stachybotrys elegans]|uniref:Uncharacterized protein n=1 Tax=Stachybotrys elegans TaxID=80388 RepID=A0A8K0SYW0_9HYPO|nr:hypothetical protein B0I35DRAFT_198982 [Stachybotrys elegans]
MATVSQQDIPSGSCVTLGDGDIYGLGVRIGLYLQWASGFILRLLGSWPRVSGIRTTNNILCGALVVAEFIHIIDGSALSIEYLLSYYLTIVLFYAESYNLVRRIDPEGDRSFAASMGYDTGVYRLYPDFPLIFQNLLFASYTLFGAWFWQSGIDGTRRTTCDDRAAIVFLFALRNPGWTTAATVLASIAGALFALIFFMHLKNLKKGVISGPELVFARALRVTSGAPLGPENIGIPALLRPELPKPRGWSISSIFHFLREVIHFTLINLVGPVVAIVSVERMIQANKLQTPSVRESTGQMIALFTGATSFMVALWEFGRAILNGD